MITSTGRKVETDGITQEAFFSIDQEGLPYVFNILRNQLYTDKILAVVREYSSNALDAHVAAGTPDRPIDISLPTPLSQFFRVRDYGPGLSEEDIYSIYRFYGSSTKRDSNAYIGCMGIGSKAAFAYVDAFSVISYYQNIKSTYQCYIDETGVGKIAKIAEEPTEEEPGVEILVPVATQGDFHKFEQTVGDRLAFMSPTPLVNGSPLEARNRVCYIKLTPRFWLDPNSYGGASKLVMGGVTYTLPYGQIEFNGNFVVFTDIGAVDIAANRETVQLTKKTMDCIRDLRAEGVATALGQVQVAVDQAPTAFEALIAQQGTIAQRVRDFLGRGHWVGQWQGKDLSSLAGPLDTRIEIQTPNTYRGRRSSVGQVVKEYNLAAWGPPSEIPIYLNATGRGSDYCKKLAGGHRCLIVSKISSHDHKSNTAIPQDEQDTIIEFFGAPERFTIITRTGRVKAQTTRCVECTVGVFGQGQWTKEKLRLESLPPNSLVFRFGQGQQEAVVRGVVAHMYATGWWPQYEGKKVVLAPREYQYRVPDWVVSLESLTTSYGKFVQQDPAAVPLGRFDSPLARLLGLLEPGDGLPPVIRQAIRTSWQIRRLQAQKPKGATAFIEAIRALLGYRMPDAHSPTTKALEDLGKRLERWQPDRAEALALVEMLYRERDETNLHTN